jgi:hypothetical protein
MSGGGAVARRLRVRSIFATPATPLANENRGGVNQSIALQGLDAVDSFPRLYRERPVLHRSQKRD